MLRFEDIVFGPVHSRRLGTSLGVNLLPAKGKFCNFDCIYCECGWNKDGMDDRRLPGLDEVRNALEERLSTFKAEGMKIDTITFSGNGEPTLNPDFPAIIDAVLDLRDRFFPESEVSVLSNATTVWNEDVFRALRKTDNPIMKIDASSDKGVMRVNKPSGSYSLDRIIEGLSRFDGDFILQTMFTKCDGFSSSDDGELQGWMDIARLLKPRKIMVYTLDRETPEKGLYKFSVEEMKRLVSPLESEGFHIQING